LSSAENIIWKMGDNEGLPDFGLVDEETYSFLDQLFEGDIDVVELQTIPSNDGDGAQFLQVQPQTETVETQPTSTSKDLRELQRKTSKIYKIVDNQSQLKETLNGQLKYFKVHICSYDVRMFLKFTVVIKILQRTHSY